jgi:hypothetical protein
MNAHRDCGALNTYLYNTPLKQKTPGRAKYPNNNTNSNHFNNIGGNSVR